MTFNLSLIRFLTTLSLSLICVKALAYKGIVSIGESGGGGAVVNCPDRSTRKSRRRPELALLDLVEARRELRLKVYPSTEPYEQRIQNILEEYQNKYRDSTAQLIREQIQQIRNSIVPVESLVAPNDQGKLSPSILKGTCHLSWVAYYNNNKLHLVEELFNRLPELDKAALFFHEALYKIAREVRDDEVSEQVRRAVAYVFSELASAETYQRLERLMRAPFFSSSQGGKNNFRKVLNDDEVFVYKETAMENGSRLGDCKGGPDLYSRVRICINYSYMSSGTEPRVVDSADCFTVGDTKPMEVNKNTRVEKDRLVKMSGAKLNKKLQKMGKKIQKKYKPVSLGEPYIFIRFRESVAELCEWITHDGPAFTELGKSSHNLFKTIDLARENPVFVVTGDRDPLKIQSNVSYKDIKDAGYSVPKVYHPYTGMTSDPLGVLDWEIRSEALIYIE